MLGTVELQDLRVSCIVGVLPHERTTHQTVALDVSMDLDLAEAVKTENVHATVDYAETATAIELLLVDQRFQRDAQAMPGHREAFDQIFVPWCMSRTKRQIWDAAMQARVFCAPLNTTLDILADPHFLARGAWVSRLEAPARSS